MLQRSFVPSGEGGTAVIRRGKAGERKLTRELFVIFLAGLFCALFCTIFMMNRRFGFYAWVLDHGVIEDSRKEYSQWLKKETPAFHMDRPEEYMPYFAEKADDYTWMGIYDKKNGTYIDSLFPRILDSRIWGSWSWSDTDIAAQTMEPPVEFETQFSDGTARVQLMSYQSLKFFPVFYLSIVILDSLWVLGPILIFVHKKMKYLGRVRCEAAVMGQGDMEHPVTVKGKDEIAALAKELDELRLALKISMENERQAHMDNQELIRALSHDIRTPLTVLNGYLEILRRKKGDQENYPQYVQKCLIKTEELRGMTDKMFEYALVFENPGKTAMQDYSLREFAGELQEQLEYLELQGFSVGYGRKVVPDERWKANPFLIQRLFTNLCSNILRYGKQEHRVTADIYMEERKVIVILENVIAEQRQAAGSGVGLKSAARIAELHGGEMVWTEKGDIFQVKISIPVY